jgi:hypothetical protein
MLRAIYPHVHRQRLRHKPRHDKQLRLNLVPFRNVCTTFFIREVGFCFPLRKLRFQWRSESRSRRGNRKIVDPPIRSVYSRPWPRSSRHPSGGTLVEIWEILVEFADVTFRCGFSRESESTVSPEHRATSGADECRPKWLVLVRRLGNPYWLPRSCAVSPSAVSPLAFTAPTVKSAGLRHPPHLRRWLESWQFGRLAKSG